MSKQTRFFYYGLLIGGTLGFAFSVVTAFVGPTILSLLAFPIMGAIAILLNALADLESEAK